MKNGGGPAFPLSGGFDPDGYERTAQFGMSLRDWFAGMVLQGMLAGNYRDGVLRRAIEDDVSSGQVLAAVSYDMADAMIAEREKE